MAMGAWNRCYVVGLVLWFVFLGAGCGGDDAERAGLEDLLEPQLDSESNDWVVQGMRCDGAAVTRFVTLVEDDDEMLAHYVRGDDCVDAGDDFWTTGPEQEGDEIELVIGSQTDTRRSVTAERDGDHRLRFVGDGEEDDLEMHQVYRSTGPSPIPDLSDFDLAGQWWMEGYPCVEDLVPQLVRIIHPPGSLHMTKVVGDDCIGEGENFLDGQVSGTSVSGEAHLQEQSEMGFGDDEELILETTGTVRTEHFIGLDVDGQAVTLRRVLGESAQ